jgi:hypothetical protein
LVLDVAVVVSFFAISIVLMRLIHGGFNTEFALTALVAVDGFVIGAFLSFVFTPYTMEERRQWSQLAAAIAGLIAGYSLKVLGDAISYLFSDARLFRDVMIGAGIAVFISWLGFGLIYGFVYRRYYIEFDLVSRRRPSQSKSAS